MTCTNMEQIILKTLHENGGGFHAKDLLWAKICNDNPRMNNYTKIFNEAFANCLAKGLIRFRPGTNLVELN